MLREFLDNNGNGVYDAGDNLLTRFDYTVAADGRRTGAVEQFWFEGEMHENTVAWSYDNLGRLVDEVFDHYDDAFDQTDRFVHDLVGNRLVQTRDLGNDDTIDETTGYVYDANDRLQTEWFDGDGLPGAERETGYGYDRTQETLKEVREEGVLQSRTEYTYNLQGRMATVTVTSFESGVASRVERSTYEYNAAGIRVSALVETDADGDGTFDTATKSEYLNDPHNHTGYSQVLVETTAAAATGEVQKRVAYTLGHDRLSQTTTTYAAGEPTATETLYFGQDGHGSTRVLFDALGAIATVAGLPQVFHYAAHGTPLGFDPSTAATTFLYSGEQTDATGLQYLRARYYNPATGRFTRLDPFFGVLTDPQSLHKYLYCHADPVMGVDPSGELLASVLWGSAIGGVMGGGIAGAVGYAQTRSLRFAADMALRGLVIGAIAGATFPLFGAGAMAGAAGLGLSKATGMALAFWGGSAASGAISGYIDRIWDGDDPFSTSAAMGAGYGAGFSLITAGVFKYGVGWFRGNYNYRAPATAGEEIALDAAMDRVMTVARDPAFQQASGLSRSQQAQKAFFDLLEQVTPALSDKSGASVGLLNVRQVDGSVKTVLSLALPANPGGYSIAHELKHLARQAAVKTAKGFDLFLFEQNTPRFDPHFWRVFLQEEALAHLTAGKLWVSGALK